MKLCRVTTVCVLASACGPVPRPQWTAPSTAAASCVASGTWVVPATGEVLAAPVVIERAAAGRIVLLGEEHDQPEHHLWQLQTIAALYGRRQSIVIGLEMFPRKVQPVLDEWVAEMLDERRFLIESGWATFWDLPADLYLPLFRFARLNHVPMVALNVPRALVTRVAADGWEHVPAEEREGLSEPAPPVPAYEKWLTESFHQHIQQADVPPPGDASRFVAAQLVWDRAFAQALAAAARRRPEALVIGVIGGGHLQHRYGVPHQLASLGIDGVTVLLPWAPSHDCGELTADYADVVFGIEPQEAPPATRPLLGISITIAPGGISIIEVRPGGVAAAAGLRAGDVIVEAAGFPLRVPSDLQQIVARQAPGTWLPLRVRRARKVVKIVARFPTAF